MRTGRSKSLSCCGPRSRRRIPSRSCSSSSRSERVVSETRIWPPWPASQIRAARWTASPTYWSPASVASPVWIPIRTRRSTPSGQSWAASARCAATAASTAWRGRRKATKNESPSLSSSRPPDVCQASRSRRLCSAITSPYSSRSLRRSAVDPSTSLNRKVSVVVALSSRPTSRGVWHGAGVAEDSYHPPHLRERVTARLLDDEQRLEQLLLVGLEPPPHRRRLDRHHADAVADHVVELAGDPGALLRDGAPRLLLPLRLRLLGQASRSIGLAQASAEGEADEPGDREGDERPDVVARRSPVLVVGRDDHGGCLHHTPAGDRRAAIRTQPEPDADPERDEERRDAVVDEAAVGERARNDDDGCGDRRSHREPAAEEEDADEADRDQDVEPRRALRAVFGVGAANGDRQQAAQGREQQGVDPEPPRQRPDAAHESGSLALSR